MPGADQRPPLAPQPVLHETLIEVHLQKVLGSRVFRTADSLRELLRFTVHETMAGRGRDLKEFSLATSVLARGNSFDPKADPIVRVQMRRLRERLNRYYTTEGRHDAILIDIPKGTYTPTFRSAAPPGAPAVPAVMEEGVLVGREEELAGLRAAFESAAAGRGGLFSLAGEPGIGKTTVVEAFLGEIAASGVECYVARGRCSERLAGSEAYLPVLEALETLVGGNGEPLGRLLGMLAPTWSRQIAPAVADPPADRIAPQGGAPSQERLKRELVAFLEELTRRKPVVLFLDDLHWADASTVDVLSYVGTRCRSQRILILAAYRPSELLPTNHPFLSVKLELQGHGICREIPLQFLSRADVDRYLDLRFPGHLFPAELSARLHARTEGNPLFMADLVRFLRDRGVLAQREGRWVIVGRLPEVERELPESVRSMVEKKIAQLAEADRRLLVAASVQGYEFDSAVVSAAQEANAAEVEERLEVLERVHSFVRLVSEQELPDRTLTLRYRFVHVLYQNALYASLQPSRKASLSAAVAEALLGYFGTQRSAIASELALLWHAARDFERAAEYFLLAAEQAVHVSANLEAVVLARRGLEALAHLPDTPQRAERELRLQITLGPALMGTVGFGAPEVEAVYARARGLCPRVGETPLLFVVTWGLYQYAMGRADYQTCRELCEQMLILAEKLQDPVFLVLAHNSLANTCWVSGDFEAVLTHSEQVIAIYVPQQHHALASRYSGWDPAVACRCGMAVNLWLLGYPDQAVQRGQEGITLAREMSHAYSVVFALTFNAMVHQHRRDALRTRHHAEAAIALATEQELAPWVAWGTELRGWALAEQGQVEEGIAQVRQGIAFWQAAGSGALVPYFLALLAEAYAKMGKPEEALTALSEALTITTKQTHEGYMEAELYRLKGELLPEPAEAEACFHQAIEIARRQKARSFELRAVMGLGRLYRKRGKDIAARQMLAEIYGLFTEGFDTADLQEAAVLLKT